MKYLRAIGPALSLTLLLAFHAQAQTQEQAQDVHHMDAPLPALGDSATQTLSLQSERRLGDRIMRSVWQDTALVDDPLLREYIQRQWRSLLDGAKARGDLSADMYDAFAWSTFLVQDKTLNAFALPGGYIGIHLGLIAGTQSIDELAAVLAHELSHVTQRHIARNMAQAKQVSWVSMAAMVLGALAASRSSEAAQALIVGGQGLSAQAQLNFSRDMEREADRIGFGVLVQSGYAPQGMMQMFEQLQQASRLNDDNSFPYLRTHPLTVERIGEARSRMGDLALNHVTPSRTSLHHELIKARAKVLMDVRSAALQPFLRLSRDVAGSTPTTKPQIRASLLEHYTRLVAATQLKDWTIAAQSAASLEGLIAPLADEDKGGIQRLLQLAEIEYMTQAGQTTQALLLLKSMSNGRPESLLMGQLALGLPASANAVQTRQEAISALQTLVSTHPEDASAWSLLAALWSRMDEPLRAIRADAEAAAARGDIQGAIDRAESARRRFDGRTPAQLIELSVLDSRAHSWRKTLKEDEQST